jgi:hypothetical protein
MNKTSAIRAILGTATAIVVASSAPALASAGGPTGHAQAAAATAVRAAATCSPGARACPIRITFARGAFSGQAHSTLTGITSEKSFVVRAAAGQTMVVVVEGKGPTRGVVVFPNGHSDGQPGGRIFDGNLPASGDYRIRVTESSMGEAWSGRVDVVVLIY